jgi:hypothetical protein
MQKYVGSCAIEIESQRKRTVLVVSSSLFATFSMGILLSHVKGLACFLKFLVEKIEVFMTQKKQDFVPY